MAEEIYHSICLPSLRILNCNLIFWVYTLVSPNWLNSCIQTCLFTSSPYPHAYTCWCLFASCFHFIWFHLFVDMKNDRKETLKLVTVMPLYNAASGIAYLIRFSSNFRLRLHNEWLSCYELKGSKFMKVTLITAGKSSALHLNVVRFHR